MSNYLPSCITVVNFLARKNKMIDATPDMKTKSMKKSYILFISYPRKEVTRPLSGYNVLKTPASLLPAALERNHTAINKEANLKGASLFTNANPMGEIHNSPQVCRAY